MDAGFQGLGQAFSYAVKMLVTGGAGFIGSCYLRLIRRLRPDDLVVNVDVLTYAGNLENLQSIAADPGYHFVKADWSVGN